MKYFAKWLPLERDLNFQIWQWYNNIANTGWELISCSDMDAIIAHGLQPTPKFRRVKLFLCSKDIQVDEQFNDTDSNHICSRITDVIIDKEGLWHNPKTCFKVVGEISPDATWVKEDDAFEKGDVVFVYINTHFPDEEVEFNNPSEFLANEYYHRNREKFVMIVKIKCPTCKTYH